MKTIVAKLSYHKFTAYDNYLKIQVDMPLHTQGLLKLRKVLACCPSLLKMRPLTNALL